MIDAPAIPIIALATGAGAVLVWATVLIRSLLAYRRGREQRWSWLVMPITALIVAFGTLASAFGVAVARGLIVSDVDTDVISLVASMGRGALLTAGFIVLAHYRPKGDR